MKVLIALGTISLSLTALIAPTKLGAGVTLGEATPIRSLVERPQDFVGKTIRVDGVATAVCAHLGCWMAIAPPDGDKQLTVRVKVDDGVIVIPVTAKGRKVSAEGVFETVGAAGDSREAAAEHAKADPKAPQQHHLKATGALIHE